ncbi:hypothetical protein [Halorubrum sp. BV1]|uniref:hypothetical protein n=1 Tax=Halorubrum sp. BV1 TaxID=1498500 RepID=UPI0012BA61A8|nr:hypothetical protein [Halorubrum sp. BV1]
MNIPSLVKNGAENPSQIPGFVQNKISEYRTQFQSELYCRANNISQTDQLIHSVTSSQDEFCIIVLDACRYDYFSEEYSDFIRGDCRRAWSPVPYTKKFFRDVFTDYYDLTYISATPQISNLSHSDSEWSAEATFKDIIHVWKHEWDHKLTGMRAEAVTEAALNNVLSSSETRMIVHYIPPHFPYIGETQMDPFKRAESEQSDTILGLNKEDWLEKNQGGKMTEAAADAFDIDFYDLEKYNITPPGRLISDQVSEGRIPDEELRQAYRSNVRYAISEASRLASFLSCPTYITADHGEFLGETGRYFHPDSAHRIVREVPWFSVDSDMQGERDIEDYEFEYSVAEWESKDIKDDRVEEQLRDLGYM